MKKDKQKKNKKNIQEEVILNVDKDALSSELLSGTRTVKDLMAPSQIKMPDDSHLVVGDKYVRNFVMQGYPSRVSVGWLNDLYSFNGDMDTMVTIVPADDRKAQDELTRKIAEYESQLAVELEKGSIQHITDLRNKVKSLYAEREKLEQNIESLYHMSITANMMADSLAELNKQTQMLDNKLKGKRMTMLPTYLRMDEGFKTALPFAKNFMKDKLRNINTGGVISCFPFYNNEITHPNGVFIGLNMSTATPMFIDFYDKTKLNNTNFSVFGRAGSGKSFFVNLLTMRSALKNIRTTIIDPEGEYKPLTEALGGVRVVIAPDSKHRLNPFDIEEEEELDADGYPTGKFSVNIKEKVADLLNLVSVMCGQEGVSAEERSLISAIIMSVYRDFGITEDPDSLYEENDDDDTLTSELRRKKTMPTFSDFHNKLSKMSQLQEGKALTRLVNALSMFKKGGTYDIFDTQSTFDTSLFKSAPIVTFDVSKLEESILRPIGMYIALSWTWEKFGKKNPQIKKRIVCDEAWMLVKKNMAGHEYTSKFLETCARRIRKRNGGLLVASQNFIEFANSDEGMAVLSNTAVQIFMKQSSTDIDALQNKYHLSDGERNFLLTAQTGQMLIKTEDESSIAYVYPFDFEKELIKKAEGRKM